MLDALCKDERNLAAVDVACVEYGCCVDLAVAFVDCAAPRSLAAVEIETCAAGPDGFCAAPGSCGARCVLRCVATDVFSILCCVTLLTFDTLMSTAPVSSMPWPRRTWPVRGNRSAPSPFAAIIRSAMYDRQWYIRLVHTDIPACCAFERGSGRVFYFSPGHETFPVYHDPIIQQILANAVIWARSTTRSVRVDRVGELAERVVRTGQSKCAYIGRGDTVSLSAETGMVAHLPKSLHNRGRACAYSSLGMPVPKHTPYSRQTPRAFSSCVPRMPRDTEHRPGPATRAGTESS
jgi:hypothetical protein